MPKLLQINSNVNSGGAGRIVEQIGYQAIKSGWESYIAYGRLENKSESKTIKIGKNKDVIIHGVVSLLFDKHGFASSNATNELIETIKNIKPRITFITLIFD